MEELKLKLFKIGFYGIEMKNLTSDEQELALKADFIEIITKETLNHLKSNFTNEALPNTTDITEETIARLNNYMWRNIGTNNKFSFNTEFNFRILNYIVCNEGDSEGWINTLDIRKNLEIDPKRVFYFIKIAKNNNLVEEKKVNHETFIRYIVFKNNDPLIHEGQDESDIKDVFGPSILNESGMAEKIIIARNKPVYYTYYDIIKNTTEGVTASTIAESFGETVKGSGRMLSKLISKNKEFKVCSEVVYKTTTNRIFTKENYEIYLQKKKDRIMGVNTDYDIENLSTADRKLLIQKMVEKYGAFAFDKEILEEMRELCGYKHSFDNKSLLVIARTMDNVKIFDVEEGNNVKHVLARSDLEINDLEIQDAILQSSYQSRVLSDFQIKIKKFFLQSERVVYRDNGYPANEAGSLYNFYNFLKSKADENGNVKFFFNTILKMTVKEYASINKILRLHFKQLLAARLYKSCNRGIKELFEFKKFKDVFFTFDIFVDGDYKKHIQELAAMLDDIQISSFYHLAGYKTRQFIKYISPNQYSNKIKSLSYMYNLLEYEEVDGYFNIKILNTAEREKDLKQSIVEIPHFYYPNRMKFVDRIIDFDESEFISKAIEEAQSLKSNEAIQFYMNLIKSFSKVHLSDVKTFNILNKSNNLGKRAGLMLKNLYKRIKYELMINQFLCIDDLNNIANASNSQVYLLDVMNMLKSKSIIGKIFANNVSKTSISVSFKNKFKIKNDRTGDITVSAELVDDRQYYDIFYPTISDFVEEMGSIDLIELTNRLKYLENFELEEFFQIYSEEFTLNKYDSFTVISKEIDSKNIFNDFM
ncbi:hypothetical protein A0H76_1139 [Hepatospora eriocheir]|uniref:Uncharacterized protein n=1 Tax=Hepatospora eriocheir TaxID=1081669 RepID=A0A1X0QHM1_9MICR|nr:hypothetical protein A0H76_1139 [Hepatospora eriocheir]